jgi:hypothetical protein
MILTCTLAVHFAEVSKDNLVERKLSVLALEYNTTSQQLPSEIDYVELSRVTANLLSNMYSWYFTNIKVVKYKKLDVQRYTAIGPRLVQFEVTVTFHESEGIVVPSIGQVEAVVEHGLAEGSDYYDIYLYQLQSMPFGVFSSTTSFRAITDAESLRLLIDKNLPEIEEAETQDTKLFTLLAAAAAVTALLICVATWSYARSRHRSAALEQLDDIQAKAMDEYRKGYETQDESSTAVADFRTSSFSDSQSRFPATFVENSFTGEEEALEYEIKAVMGIFEDVSLADGDESITARIGEMPKNGSSPKVYQNRLLSSTDGTEEHIQADQTRNTVRFDPQICDATDIKKDRSVNDGEALKIKHSAVLQVDEFFSEKAQEAKDPKTPADLSVTSRPALEKPVWAVRSFQKPILKSDSPPCESANKSAVSEQGELPALKPAGVLKSPTQRNGSEDATNPAANATTENQAMQTSLEESTLSHEADTSETKDVDKLAGDEDVIGSRKPAWVSKTLRPVVRTDPPETKEEDESSVRAEEEEVGSRNPVWMSKKLRHVTKTDRVGEGKAPALEEDQEIGSNKTMRMSTVLRAVVRTDTSEDDCEAQNRDENKELGSKPVWMSKGLRLVVETDPSETGGNEEISAHEVDGEEPIHKPGNMSNGQSAAVRTNLLEPTGPGASVPTNGVEQNPGQETHPEEKSIGAKSSIGAESSTANSTKVIGQSDHKAVSREKDETGGSTKPAWMSKRLRSIVQVDAPETRAAAPIVAAESGMLNQDHGRNIEETTSFVGESATESSPSGSGQMDAEKSTLEAGEGEVSLMPTAAERAKLNQRQERNIEERTIAGESTTKDCPSDISKMAVRAGSSGTRESAVIATTGTEKKNNQQEVNLEESILAPGAEVPVREEDKDDGSSKPAWLSKRLRPVGQADASKERNYTGGAKLNDQEIKSPTEQSVQGSNHKDDTATKKPAWLNFRGVVAVDASSETRPYSITANTNEAERNEDPETHVKENTLATENASDNNVSANDQKEDGSNAEVPASGLDTSASSESTGNGKDESTPSWMKRSQVVAEPEKERNQTEPLTLDPKSSNAAPEWILQFKQVGLRKPDE